MINHAACILRVAVAAPLPELFDYLPPADLTTPPLIGMRVRVPFGHSQRVGMIVAIAQSSALPPERLKPITRLLDTQPLLNAADISFLLWSANYYRGFPGEAVFSALPTRLRHADHSINPPAPAIESNPIESNPIELPTLNTDQTAALAAIHNQSGFNCFLLDGVTGSGKTEVYLRLIATTLARGGQVLVLVPEIGLTPQLQRRFAQRLSAPIAVIHSNLTANSRELAWWQVVRGTAGVLLGTRSAVFTPIPKLALVIVDEEHDVSLKQQDGWRYSARDLAVRRAQLADCPVILGSATPALESLRNAQLGRYHHLLLPRRAGTARSPQLVIADLRTQPVTTGLSHALLTRMETELISGNQVLLFLNRRGFAPVLSCQQCEWISTCAHCDAKLTVHRDIERLVCHHCGHSRALPNCCPECGGTKVRPLGQGTERVADYLRRRYPDYPIGRIDRDSTRRKGELERLLTAARRGEYPILLGTQMLAKGHHLPGVTLVGILSLDQGLHGVEFRATERMAQLMVQVAGRAGRAERAGTVLLQTRYPEHPLLLALLQQGYAGFAAQALVERETAQLPPFSYQALLRADSRTSETAMEFLQQAATVAPALGTAELWGPAPAPMARRARRHRAQLLLQAPTRQVVQMILNEWLPRVRSLSQPHQLRWSVDVDPQEGV